MELIKDTVSGARLGDPKTFRNMTIFPVFGQGTTPDYLTLDEALAHNAAKVTEVSEGGSVPELRFVNEGDMPVFLMDGEELIGAKQNRTLNLSILVPARKTIGIPVSCVERGRWSRLSREFSSAPRAQYAEGRARKMAQVSASMESSGARHSDQGEVWRDIEAKFTRLRISSRTSAMSDIFEQHSARLEEYANSFSPAEGQLGAVFTIEGKVCGFELFDSPDTLKKLWPKLLRSYGLDALDRADSAHQKEEKTILPGPDDVESFLRRVSTGKTKKYPAVGEGDDIRLASPGLTGAALAAHGRVVHLSAFAI